MKSLSPLVVMHFVAAMIVVVADEEHLLEVKIPVVEIS
jgi:hypothetical protein